MNFGKKILAASIIASSMLTVAYADDVPCPSAATIKGTTQALNAVIRQSEDGFFVLTAQPAVNDSDLSWVVMAQIKAKSFDPAYTRGVSEVKAVTMPAMDTAIEMQGMYVCAYMTSSGGMSVMAAAQQQQGIIFNPAKLNLDALRNLHK
jgi:hypothetical protein